MTALAESLHAEIGRLWQTPRPSSAGLRQIARSLLLEASDAQTALELFSRETIRPESALAESIACRSVLAARTIAWFARQFVSLQSREEELVLATLLTDAGKLRPATRTVADFAAQSGDDHPLVSAAFAAGFSDVPAALSLRISRHHERSDGTGSPNGLTAARLSVDDRVLSASVRFAELFEESPLAAAKRLHHEARLGGFDAELTANLLWSMGGEFPVDAALRQRSSRPWVLTDHGRRRLRLDDAHLARRPPHFLVSPKRITRAHFERQR